MILKWSEFIKESKSEEKEIWKLHEDEILELFYNVTDEGYVVEVEFGFIINDVFSKMMLSGDYKVAYFIRITETKRITNINIVNDIQTAYNILSEDFDIKTQDSGSTIDISSLGKDTGGLYINDINGDEVGGVEDYFSILISEREYTKFTDIDLLNYYKWSGCKVKDNKVFLDVKIDDMITILLSGRSDYKNILEKGIDEMWDNYETYYYRPDTQSMFDFSLTDENCKLLIKSIIKEIGGLGNMISCIGDECSDVSYDYVKGKSEEEVIEYLLKERHYRCLEQICKGSEIYQEVNQTIADWNMNAHVIENYKEIVDEFDRIVSKEFTYTKIEKDETKRSTSKDGKVTEYNEIVTYYEIPFSNKWIENETEFRNISNSDISSIFLEWADNEMHSYNIEPHFSDYGHVDRNALNIDINSDLKRYLSK